MKLTTRCATGCLQICTYERSWVITDSSRNSRFIRILLQATIRRVYFLFIVFYNMTVNCYFKFVRSTPIFYSNDQISGNVILVNNKLLQIQTLNLKVVGLYRVQWNEKSTTPHIIEHGDDTLHILHPLNLNTDAIYRVPLEILDRKRFWSFCCPTGPLTVKFSMPYCGYAPGQKIHFVIYINNESSIDITTCAVKLNQEVSYESHDPQHEFRYDKHLIAQRTFGNVLRWSRKVYRGYLNLPSIPPTSVKLSCPINVSYCIKIIVKPTDFHCKMKLKIPLTIGSIPILDNGLELNDALLLSQQLQPEHLPFNNNIDFEHNDQSQEITTSLIERRQTNVNDDNDNNTPIIVVGQNDSPPEYMTMMPPSYEEAMALSDQFFDDTELLQHVSISSITTCNGKTDIFKPRYPVYYDYETPIIPPGSDDSASDT